jgi:hypothetical protein
MRRSKVERLTGILILAACMVGVVNARASQGNGDSSDVPAKQARLEKHKKSKATREQRDHAKGNEQSKAAAKETEADQVLLLKQQLALQQKQINQLLHAVAELSAHLGIAAQPAPAASATQPANNAEVASLVPILPPEPKTQAGATHQLLSMNTSVKPAGVGSTVQAAPGVSNAVAEVPAAEKQKKSNPLDLDGGKVKIGATFYGFYRYFTQTGFGPQTLDNTDIHPGPGNNGFNEFNVNRTYINIFYSPNDALTFRVTPNVFRQVGGASAEKLSSTSGTGASVNGNLSFRLKYAYVDFNKPFAHSEAFGKDKLTFGQQPQPLTDWEEGLYGYRFVNLTPWNYWSLSSTYPGVKLHGPIEFNGKQYLDYEIGVFNDSSYHAYEVGERKQVMARLSYYPFGTVSKYQGLGLTGFVDYGYKDAAPDQNVKVPLTRVAALIHYQSKSGDYGIAGEYDYGRNAFSLGNLYSGSGPNDYFDLGMTQYADFNSLAGALLAGSHTNQRGIDFFGHARLGKSPFYLFGMFEQFNPNTNVATNPLDFRTVIGGISYKYGKYWQFAVDSQNILYYHGQFTFPASELSLFSPSLAASNPNGIPNAVPQNINAIFFNVLFNY